MIGFACAAGGAALFPGNTRAAEATWTGTDGAWDDSANWSTGAVPDAATDVFFSTSAGAEVSDGSAAASLSVYARPINTPHPEVVLSAVPGAESMPTLQLGGDLRVGAAAFPSAEPDPSQQHEARLTVFGTRVQVGGDVVLGRYAPGEISTAGQLYLDQARLDVAGTVRTPNGYIWLGNNTLGGDVELINFGRIYSAGGTVDGDVSLVDAYLELGQGSVAITGDLSITQVTPSPLHTIYSGLLLSGNSVGLAGKVTVGGDLALGGDLLFHRDPAGPAWTVGQSFDLLDFDPARLTGTFNRLYLPPLAAGQSWDTSRLYTTGTVQIVPEPTAFAAVLGATALVAGSSRRRRRQ